MDAVKRFIGEDAVMKEVWGAFVHRVGLEEWKVACKRMVLQGIVSVLLVRAG